MKKIFFSLSALLLMTLSACSNSETNNASTDVTSEQGEQLVPLKIGVMPSM